ncbi:Hypothetical_protein [Hexamita inflata]|uniref:Hypothetical_protein n=1 Tax=Hexamita inflata TaxID=28002 RepID=A0AA86NYW0_9EUKA|nr:Hypothetical protein HINF_LOCUS14919 [Hexamita inflata]
MNQLMDIKQRYSSRQEQHKKCTEYIIKQQISNIITDFTTDNESFQQLQSFHFDELIPQKPFKQQKFKQLIASAQQSRSQSLSNDTNVQNKYFLQYDQTMELFTIDFSDSLEMKQILQ